MEWFMQNIGTLIVLVAVAFVSGFAVYSMLKDKKAEGGRVHFILINEIGDVTSYSLAVDEVVRLLK